MDRNFARSLSLVLKSEGGWADNPADPGGATMKGVTIATFRRYIDPKATKDDLRHITDAQLADVYKRQYWDAIGGDQLPDGVDYATFDFAVNSGPGRAARYLQSVVGAPLDGAISSATLDAVAKLPVGVVINRLCDARLAFLKSLGTWGAFGKGWSARVASVRKEALLMTAVQQSQQNGAPAVATGPVTSVPNNLPSAPGPLAVPQVSIPAAPSAPAKVPAAPAPSKPVVKHVGIGLGAFAIGSALAQWWGDIVSWFHHWL